MGTGSSKKLRGGAMLSDDTVEVIANRGGEDGHTCRASPGDTGGKLTFVQPHDNADFKRPEIAHQNNIEYSTDGDEDSDAYTDVGHDMSGANAGSAAQPHLAAQETDEVRALRAQVAHSQQMLESMMTQMEAFAKQVQSQEAEAQKKEADSAREDAEISKAEARKAHNEAAKRQKKADAKGSKQHKVTHRQGNGGANDAANGSSTDERPALGPIGGSGPVDHWGGAAAAAAPPSTHAFTQLPLPSDPVFERFARTVFVHADVDRDGYLSPPEFGRVLSAQVLNVALDAEEAAGVFRSADKEDAGKLSFEAFCPPFRTLLQRAYHGDEYEDWVHVGFSGTSADALPVYFNWRTGEMTEMAAATDEINFEDEDDALNFDLMVREDDGMVLTTFVDETGARLYIDGETWRAVEPSWHLTPLDRSAWSSTPSSNRPASARPRDDDAKGVRDGTRSSPSHDDEDGAGDKFVYFEITDVATDTVYQCARTTDALTSKLYYDASTDSWKPLPAVWEASQPSTARLLKEMDTVLPEWRNVTEQVLALRMFQYDVGAAIAWKSADVEASGGEWGAVNIQQTALINTLEEALAKKDAVIEELRKVETKSDRVLAQAGRDLEAREQEVKDTTEQLQRSRKRITILEEELQQQFEDLQKQSTRQRGRIAVLESELESTIALSTGTRNRQEQRLAALTQKVERLEEAEAEVQVRQESKVAEIQVELAAARSEAMEATELRQEVVALKAKLIEQKAEQAIANDNAAEAEALKEQLVTATAELEASNEEARATARETAKELETTRAALDQLETSTTSKISQLKAELAQKTEELSAVTGDGMVSMSEVTLLEKEEEMKRLREQAVTLQEQVEKLKHSSTKMVGTVKFTVQDLKVAKEVLQRDTTSIISGAASVWKQLHPAVLKLLAIVNNFEDDKQLLVQKYQQEVAAKRLLYNKIQELKGNIRCFCRVRHDDRGAVAVSCISDTEILIPTRDGRTKCFEFDKVYPPDASQAQVYEDAKGIIQSTVDGYNVVYLAYGQTGSGKTFTMMGPPGDPELAGVNRRAISDLFRLCEERTDVDYTFSINMVEVYNDSIFDLLAGHHVKNIKLKQLPDGKTVLDGVTVRPVHSPDDVTAVLAEADANRTVAATAMNMHSSRSHLVLQVTVLGLNKVTEVRTSGKLSLVDLAGSERVAKSEAVGQRLLEAAAINKSLSALGQIFSALAQRQRHVPYRNSKLTHLLSDSLGGDAKACMFLNCSPLADNLAETKSTLNFGAGIAKIELGPIRKNVAK